MKKFWKELANDSLFLTKQSTIMILKMCKSYLLILYMLTSIFLTYISSFLLLVGYIVLTLVLYLSESLYPYFSHYYLFSRIISNIEYIRPTQK